MSGRSIALSSAWTRIFGRPAFLLFLGVALSIFGCQKKPPRTASATGTKNEQVAADRAPNNDPNKNQPEKNSSKTDRQEPAKQPATANTVSQSNQQPANGRPPAAIPHPRTSEFTEAQLNKDHTLFPLAFDSVTRQTYFLSNFQSRMTEDQIDRVRDLVDSYDRQFARLRDRRAAILENAATTSGVPILLRNLRVETLLLSREVRRHIFRGILTPEQQKIHQAESKARREARAKKQSAQSKENTPAPSTDPDNNQNGVDGNLKTPQTERPAAKTSPVNKSKQ